MIYKVYNLKMKRQRTSQRVTKFRLRLLVTKGTQTSHGQAENSYVGAGYEIRRNFTQAILLPTTNLKSCDRLPVQS